MATHGGAKLGARISVVVSQAIVATHAKMATMKHKLAMAVFHSISDMISDEVHQTLQPVLTHLHDKYPEDGSLKSMLDFMAHKNGQLQALVGANVLAQGLLWPVSAIVNNELAPVVYEGVSSNPHAIPDAISMAIMRARGLLNDPSFIDGMAKNGLNESWAQAMLQLQEQYPDAATMLDMVRRGVLARDTFIEWAMRSSIPPNVSEALLETLGVPLTPADAALAVLRGNMTQEQGDAVAAENGLSADKFQTLIDNTGEPLALMQLLEAYRRGFIDENRLKQGILQSRIRNEWIDVAEKLRFSPMSVSDAVNSVVQNHIDQATGQTISEQNGLDPSAFAILVETAGEPLSRTEMEDLYNRGKVTKDQVLQALRESRLKDKYGELAFELHERLIPVGDLSDAVVYGSISLETAVSKAMQHGLAEDDARIIVSAASNRKLETYRKETVTASEALYVEGALTQNQFTDTARLMGFDDAEIQAIVKAADIKRQTKLKTAAINVVRNKFIMRRITKTTASGLLDGLGVTANERDSVLELWQLEQDANARVLTPAQIVKALKLSLITEQDATDRLIREGYSDVDAALLIAGA